MPSLQMIYNVLATDSASPAFRTVGAEAKNLQRVMQEVDAKMSAASKAATAEISASLAGLDRAHQAAALQYDRANQTMIRSDDSLIVMQRKMAASTNALLAEQRKATAANLEMDAAMGKAQTDLAAKTAASAGARTRVLTSIGKGVALVGVAVAFESLKMAADFQQSTNVLVTAAGESAGALEGVRKGILKISQDTGTRWQDLVDGMYQIEKAGYRGADGLKILKAAAQAAREEGANLATVTNATTSVMASYHLGAGSAVSVTNMLKSAAGEAKTTMELFSGSLSTVLPLASANKISFADVAGSLASLTQHGTSASEAAQELAFTIRGLSAPNQVAQKEMAQLGISSVDVAQRLGDGPGGRGLAGTLNYLSQTVLSKMGPAGLILLKTFNQSKVAGADAQRMFEALPPAAQKVAKAYLDGSLSYKQFKFEAGGLSASQGALVKQWAASEQSAHGFQQALRSGVSGSQTYSDALKKMTGGANGLNTVLQLTGESAAGTTHRINVIAAAGRNAGKDVAGWASTQKLFNVQLDKFKASLSAAAITLGEKLLPAATRALGVINKLFEGKGFSSNLRDKINQSIADLFSDKNTTDLRQRIIAYSAVLRSQINSGLDSASIGLRDRINKRFSESYKDADRLSAKIRDAINTHFKDAFGDVDKQSNKMRDAINTHFKDAFKDAYKQSAKIRDTINQHLSDGYKVADRLSAKIRDTINQRISDTAKSTDRDSKKMRDAINSHLSDAYKVADHLAVKIRDAINTHFKDAFGDVDKQSNKMRDAINTKLSQAAGFAAKHWRAILVVGTLGLGALYLAADKYSGGIRDKINQRFTAAYKDVDKQSSSMRDSINSHLTSAYKVVDGFGIKLQLALHTRLVSAYKDTDKQSAAMRDAINTHLSSAYKAADSLSSKMRDAINTHFTDAFTDAYKQTSKIRDTINQHLSDGYKVADRLSNKIRDSINTHFKDAFTDVDKQSNKMRDAINTKFSEMFHSSDKSSSSMRDVTNTHLSQMSAGADSWSSRMRDSINTHFRDAFGDADKQSSRIRDTINSKISDAFHVVDKMSSQMRDSINNALSDAWHGADKYSKNIRDAINTPIRAVIEFAYDRGIVPVAHYLGGLLHEPGLSNLQPVHFAEGGMVPGNHTRDTVPIYATPGEVVVPLPVVGRFGGADALMSALGFGGGGGVGGHYALGGVIGDIGHGIQHAAGAVIGEAKALSGQLGGLIRGSTMSVLGPLLDKARQIMDGALGSQGFAPTMASFGHLLIDKVKSFISGRDSKDTAGMHASGGNWGGTPGAAGGAGRWAGTVLQALGMLGQPSTMVAGVLSLINSESGGNPNAINLWDSNAKAGHPSRGLMQTIPGTFEAYRSQSLPDNIVDPLANVYAGISYALKNYGPGMLLAGGRHSSGGGYLGYDTGGILPSGGYGVNRSGRPERILSPGQTASFDRLVKLLEHGGGQARGPLVGTVHVHDNVGLDLLLRQAQFREHTGAF